MICCTDDKYTCTPGSGGGGGGGAAGLWDATLLWEHSPGFFSCERFQGETLLGTYSTCLGFKAQLCHLEAKSVIHTFTSSESIYHIRNQGDAHCYLACEQGNLYKLNIPLGTPVLIEPQHYVMGYYDALDYGGYRYSLEKATVYPPNETMIRRNGAAWVHTHGWKAKDMVELGNSLYFSATGIDNAIRARIIRIDIADRTQHFYKKFSGWTGYLAAYDGKVWCTMETGKAMIYNTAGQEWTLPGHTSWFIGVVNGILLATSTEGDWRGDGPSYVFEFNGSDWIKVLTVPDAEPWAICPGATIDKFIFVTRNEHEHCGMGRAYELTRK